MHDTPSSRAGGYAAEWNRFITGAWRESSRESLAGIAGIAELGEAMKGKKVRWAASVYELGLTELQETAEKILRRHLDQGTFLGWPEGTGKPSPMLSPREPTEGGVYTDGSRINNRTTAATITRGEYLGRYTTVMDAEMLAGGMGLKIGDLAITDSQAAIGKIKKMQFEMAGGG